MTDYISREAFIKDARKRYCEDCDRRKGMKNGKMKFCYAIGDAPCRSCWVDDMLTEAEDFPAADVRPVRWIPVSERLPEEDGDYLTLSESYVGGKPLARVLGYSENLESVSKCDFKGVNRNGWYDYDSEVGYFEVETITHWMPLPEPPMEADE